MTQTPRTPVKWRVNFPSGEGFNPDRPSLEAACRGNRTMGSLLNYFLFRASQEAEYQGLDESCKVVTITINREDILKTARISEKTLIGFLREFNELGYVLSARYSHKNTFEVHFEAVDKAIIHPPERKLRGRPPKQKQEESCSNLEEENTSTFDENTSTYTAKLERKVEVLTGKLKSLEEKFTELQLLFTELSNKFTELQLSKSAESTSGEASSAFLEAPKNTIDISRDNKRDSVDAARIDTPTPVSSFGSHDGYTNPLQKGATDGASINDHPVPGVSAWQVAGDLDRSIHGEAEALAPATPKQPFEPPGIVRLPSKSPNQSVDTDTMPAQPQMGATNGLDRHTSPGHLLRAASGMAGSVHTGASGLHQGPVLEVTSEQTPASVQPPDHVIPPNDVIAAKQAIEVTLASEDGQAQEAERPTEGSSAGVAAGVDEVEQNVSVPPVDSSSFSNTSRAAKAQARSADTTSVPVLPPSPQAGQAGPGAALSDQQTDLFGEPETREQSKGKGKRGNKSDGTQAGPPQMPPFEAPWNDETGVQIVEAINKRRYSETTRRDEIREMKKICAMVYGDGKITRQQFELAWREMVSWSWWSEHNMKPMIKHLRKDDKIITILEDLDRRQKLRPMNNGSGNGKVHPIPTWHPTKQIPKEHQIPYFDYEQVRKDTLV